jgi:hypothetical protein
MVACYCVRVESERKSLEPEYQCPSRSAEIRRTEKSICSDRVNCHLTIAYAQVLSAHGPGVIVNVTLVNEAIVRELAPISLVQ